MRSHRARKMEVVCGLLLAALCVPLFLARALQADSSSVVRAAEHQFEAGNYAGAISTLQPLLSAGSPNAEAYYWLGRSYYELRQYDNAIQQAEKSVALDAKSSLYHQWLGRAYGAKADAQKSFFLARKVKKELQESVQLNPANISARADLEDFCLAAPWIVGGNKDEARDQADAIASLDAAAGHIARAKFLQDGVKRLDLAENEFRLAIAAKPKQVEPYLEVAGFFMSQNQAPDMQMAIDAAAQVEPADPRLLFYRGVAVVLSGTDSSHGEEYLKSYLASTPERSEWPPHAAAREWLGRLYEAQGKRAEAAEQYRAALQLDPNRKQARMSLEKLEKL